MNSRRRDASRTRAEILAVAKERFSRQGYDGTTVRAVAADAGVAPNLVTRYFGGKDGLWREATEADLGVPAVLPGSFEELGGRIAANVVRRWSARSADDPLVMMIRSAGGSEAAGEHLGRFFAEQAQVPLARHLQAELGLSAKVAQGRAAAVGALIMGVVMQRYVSRFGPLTAMSDRALLAWLGDAVQSLLDG